MMVLEQGKIIAGRYVLERPLGQGGMGEVWVARHLVLGRLFALKTLKKSAIASADARGRFQREATIAGSLVSPYIAQVTDSGIDDDETPYMVMELLEGEDLHKRIKREGRLSPKAVIQIATQVGKALRVAHTAGLVHRDLKPANILMSRQDDEEIVKVLDFGIAKVVSGAHTDYTMTGELLGTAVFMSPEHIQNAKGVDYRADLWSFAVTLFRALTGEYPFPGPSVRFVMAIQSGEIPAPQRATAVIADLPPALDVFFERTFARDPEARYPSAQAMVEAFCRAVGAAGAVAPAAEPLTDSPSLPPQPLMRLGYGPGPAAAPASVPAPAQTPLPAAAAARPRHLAATVVIAGSAPSPAPATPGADDPADATTTIPRPPRAAPLGAQTAVMLPGQGPPGLMAPMAHGPGPLQAPYDPAMAPQQHRPSIGIPLAPPVPARNGALAGKTWLLAAAAVALVLLLVLVGSLLGRG